VSLQGILVLGMSSSLYGVLSLPAVMFSSQGMALIALEMRPVAARFAGVGQINQFPGTWNPQWESTEVGEGGVWLCHEPG
jgi:hypothetical protein